MRATQVVVCIKIAKIRPAAVRIANNWGLKDEKR